MLQAFCGAEVRGRTGIFFFFLSPRSLSGESPLSLSPGRSTLAPSVPFPIWLPEAQGTRENARRHHETAHNLAMTSPGPGIKIESFAGLTQLSANVLLLPTPAPLACPLQTGFATFLPLQGFSTSGLSFGGGAPRHLGLERDVQSRRYRWGRLGGSVG